MSSTPITTILARLQALQLVYFQYSDTENGYNYHCFGEKGTAKSASSWKIVRAKIDGTEIIPAGKGDFDHAATDLATVTALDYSIPPNPVA